MHAVCLLLGSAAHGRFMPPVCDWIVCVSSCNRIKARPASSQGFPASPRSLAKRNMQRSVPGALSKASALSSSGKHQPGSPTASTCSSPAWHNTAGSQSSPTSSLQSASNSVDTPSSVITLHGSQAGSVAASASLQQGTESSTPSSGDGSAASGGSSDGRSASVDRSKAWARLASIKEEKPAMQQYRVAFNLMRLRDETRSCTGWTDDDSPSTADDSRTPFQSSRPGHACSSSENDRCAVV